MGGFLNGIFWEFLICKSLTRCIYFSNFKMLPIIIIIHALPSIGYSKWIIIIIIISMNSSHLKTTSVSIQIIWKILIFKKSRVDVIRWVCHMSMRDPERDHHHVSLSHEKGCYFYIIIIIGKEEHHWNCTEPNPRPYCKIHMSYAWTVSIRSFWS